MLRCKTNENNEVTVIAEDNNQSGDGWQSFTFESVPNVSSDVLALSDNGDFTFKPCHIVENGSIRSKTVEEMS